MANSRAEVGFVVVPVVDFAAVEDVAVAGLVAALLLVAWRVDGFFVTVFAAGFSEAATEVEAAAVAGTGVDEVVCSVFVDADSTDDVLTTQDAGCSLELLLPSRFRAAVPA